jgi:hypothetical protein
MRRGFTDFGFHISDEQNFIFPVAGLGLASPDSEESSGGKSSFAKDVFSPVE